MKLTASPVWQLDGERWLGAREGQPMRRVSRAKQPWPVGGGETGACIRSPDWSTTPLCPIDRWPQSLKHTVDLLLASPLAINLMWGPESASRFTTKPTAWLACHPRWTFHYYTPTSCSWLNAVEKFFSYLTRRRLRRGVFRSLVDLQAAINRYLAEHNQNPGHSSGRPTPTKLSRRSDVAIVRWHQWSGRYARDGLEGGGTGTRGET
jgi:hypothetical protein